MMKTDYIDALSNNANWTLDSSGVLKLLQDTASVQLGASSDCVLVRDAADTLAMRRSTNPQSLALYNTYTDGSNYERLRMYWDTNFGYLSTQNAGTGSLRALRLNGGGITLQHAGNTKFVIGSAECKSYVNLFIESDSQYLAFGASNDIKLYRDAAAQLAIRDGTTAQSLAVYNTYTSASVYERARLYWDTSVCYLITEHVGGMQRALTVNAAAIRLQSAGSTKLYSTNTYVQSYVSLLSGSANDATLGIKYLTELTTIAAAATTSTTIQIPANCLVLGVSVRVTVQPPGTTTMDIGDGSTADKFGDDISTAATTTNAALFVPYASGGSALSIVFTPDSTPSTNAGRIRTTIHYIDLTAPTS